MQSVLYTFSLVSSAEFPDASVQSGPGMETYVT